MEIPREAEQETAQGHGAISIGFQDTYVDGFRVDNSTIAQNGEARLRSLEFDLIYFIADHWSLQAGLPRVEQLLGCTALPDDGSATVQEAAGAQSSTP
jgi:hypothetical protein